MKCLRGTGIVTLSLCVSIINAQDDVGTELGGGVVTRTNQEMLADLPLDIRNIDEQVAAGNGGAALDIYLAGRNAEVEPGIKKSLQSLVDELVNGFPDDATPNFLYQLYGLAAEGSRTDIQALSEQARYAENYIRGALTSNSATAAEAILVLNVWMYASHLLYSGIHKCQKMINSDEQGLFALGGGGMDEFIALWISHDSGAGTATGSGSGLYSLTNRAAGLFGETGEAKANTALKELYHEGTVVLSFPDVCNNNDERTIPQLWSVVQRMTTQMMIPLMQLLIDALMQENAERVKFLSLAVVPQVAQCRPSIYKRLKQELLGNTVSFSRNRDVINDLQQAYDCFGFTCADVGTYKVDQVPQCDDFPENFPIAEYTPTTQVHPHAKIDLDILQVKILTSLGSYLFAKFLYRFGRNSPFPTRDGDPYEVRSLEKFALSTDREAASPFYNEFVGYFDDIYYANTAVINALEGRGKYGAASVEARTEIVSKTCSYQIMYMYVLAEMADAVKDCQSKDALDNVGGVHSWDEVAAFLIGSLEGPTEGGSPDVDDGQLLWNLANKRAFQFQTVNDEGYSKTNSEIEDLLFAGGGELDAFDCESLSKTVSRLQHHLLIPVIQSTLRYAAENEKLSESNLDKTVAEGEAFALSVLPVIKSYDEPAAQVISENMVVQAGVKPVRDGAQVVADAFYEALDEFGISCTYVGASGQVDACRKEGGFSAAIRFRPTVYILSALLIVAGMAL